MVWEEARNIEGLSYFYLFIFILPPYDDKVTKYTKIHKMARIKAQRNHEAYTTWAFSTKLQSTLNINFNCRAVLVLKKEGKKKKWRQKATSKKKKKKGEGMGEKEQVKLS